MPFTVMNEAFIGVDSSSTITVMYGTMCVTMLTYSSLLILVLNRKNITRQQLGSQCIAYGNDSVEFMFAKSPLRIRTFHHPKAHKRPIIQAG